MKADLIEVTIDGSKVVNSEPIMHVHNGRASFTITPKLDGTSSKDFVLYYLKIYKTKDSKEGKEFELPTISKS